MCTPFSDELSELNQLIWGCHPVPDIFSRWCQGFSFSADEPSALVQCSGGPCAILAPVQAIIMRHVIFERKQSLSEIIAEENLDVLILSLLEIMVTVSGDGHQEWYWSHWLEPDQGDEDKVHHVRDPQPDATSSATGEIPNVNFEHFLRGLNFIRATSSDELHGIMLSLAGKLQSTYGVLCFLYSVLRTYGPAAVRKGMADEAESLIDSVHGHASQCLINLLTCGQCTPHLFDGQREISGMSIQKQPKTGFLTLFEALRFCETGWYLKNPSYPVWILGSETHFTVLASQESRLVSPENEASESARFRKAEMEFSRLSSDNDSRNGFIPADKLNELLNSLNMTLSESGIQELQKQLDPEELGVILQQPFLQHFFPNASSWGSVGVKSFSLIHYNGLQKSNPNGVVCYAIGEAHLLDPTEELTDTTPSDSSPLQRCLETKWATIRATWKDNRTPSLN